MTNRFHFLGYLTYAIQVSDKVEPVLRLELVPRWQADDKLDARGGPAGHKVNDGTGLEHLRCGSAMLSVFPDHLAVHHGSVGGGVLQHKDTLYVEIDPEMHIGDPLFAIVWGKENVATGGVTAEAESLG